MSIASKLAELLLELPARSELAYRVSRRIVNRWQGENDWRMGRNGELRFLRKVLPGSKVAFDVGANVGEWASEAISINPKLDLHCFEPCSAAFAKLQQHVAGSQVSLNKQAVGESAGMLDLYVYGESAEVNSLYRRLGADLEPLRTERVPITTLDEYASGKQIDHIDYVKVDVEGHELAVLKGARTLLGAGKIDLLQFEYGGCYIDSRTLLRDVWDLVHDHSSDYRFFKILPHGLQPVPEYRQSLENLQYSHYLLAHDRVRSADMER